MQKSDIQLAFTHVNSHHQLFYIFPPSDPLRHWLSNNRHAKPGPCSSHLLMPVLSKPHHLIHNALQGGQQGWMQFPLHMHDSAAAPHRGCGSDWPRVGSTRVRQGTHRTRLLLPWSIWWRSNVEKQTIITLISSKMTGGSLTNVSLMHFNAIQHTVASYVYIPLLYRSLCSILSVR